MNEPWSEAEWYAYVQHVLKEGPVDSMLRGEAEFDESLEAQPLARLAAIFGDRPREVAYSDYLPIEYFDLYVDAYEIEEEVA